MVNMTPLRHILLEQVADNYFLVIEGKLFLSHKIARPPIIFQFEHNFERANRGSILIVKTGLDVERSKKWDFEGKVELMDQRERTS